MVCALIHNHMGMVQFQEGDSLSPPYVLKLVDMLEVCWPLMQSCQQPQNVSHAPDQKLGALIDNKALISRIQKWSRHGWTGTLALDYDLLQVAQQVAKKHNIVVVPDHIKSHQDDSRAYNDLPWQAKLNCDCDQMAGASHKCQICRDTLHKGYDLPTGHITSLEIDGHIITSHVATAIKEASYQREFIEYITQRAGWQDKEIYHTIDWVACSRAGKQLSSGQCLTVFKLEFALFELCLNVTRWNRVLTTDAQDVNTSRKR